MKKDAIYRFVIYFALAFGWIWLYVKHPSLTSNAPFVYQEF